MRKKIMVALLLAALTGLTLIGCEDTKARQENEELKAHVAELVKESGDLGNRVDALTQENAALKQENEQLKRTRRRRKPRKANIIELLRLGTKGLDLSFVWINAPVPVLLADWSTVSSSCGGTLNENVDKESNRKSEWR